jgi:predicted PurR-regulated permease PerM
MRDRITEFLRSQAEGVDSHLLPFITAAGTGILSGLGSVIYIVLIPVLAFFFMLEGADLLRSLVKLLPTEGERVMAAILADLHAMLGQYLRALLMLSFAVFVVYTAVFSLIGVPYGILCAGIAALLEFIPVVGWITGLTITLLVSGVAGYPHLLWIVGFLLVYRIFQDYVLQPHLFGSGVEVPPILVLFGVLAGEEIAGIPGMFFSVPVIATIRTIYLQLRKRRSERDAALNAPGPKT